MTDHSLDSEVFLRGRYQFISRIGQGSQGQTFLARDLQTNSLVAVKSLHLKLTREWKAVDLFQREAEALARLNHKGIPKLIDSFEEKNGTEFYLVQSFIPGDNLQLRLSRNELFSPERLKNLAMQTLEILDYLHSQSPPILHRDIKPANLILGDHDEVSLVDFGAVQNQGSRGTTVIGTTGYMSPEQLTGRATPASDLYALAATLVHVATQTHPSDLPVERLKLQWKKRARLPEDFAAWIDLLLHPNVSERPDNAAVALAKLKHPDTLLTQPEALERILIWRENGELFLKDDTNNARAYYGFVVPLVALALLFVPALPKVLVLAAFAVASGLAWWRWHEQTTYSYVCLSKTNGLSILRGASSKNIPYEVLDGPELSHNDESSNAVAVNMRTRTGTTHKLIRNTTLAEAQWVEHHIRVWLMENRDV